jgi:hypothetical protein
MAASTRIKAENIIFKIGATDYACDANMVDLSLGDAPGDVQTELPQEKTQAYTVFFGITLVLKLLLLLPLTVTL